MKQKRKAKSLLALALFLVSVLGLAWASQITAVPLAVAGIRSTATLSIARIVHNEAGASGVVTEVPSSTPTMTAPDTSPPVHTDSTHGFSFRASSEWEVHREQISPRGAHETVIRTRWKLSRGFMHYLLLDVFEDSTRSPLVDWCENHRWVEDDPFPAVPNAIVAGCPAAVFIRGRGQATEHYVAIWRSGDTVFRVAGPASSNEFRVVLESFRLNAQKTTAITSLPDLKDIEATSLAAQHYCCNEYDSTNNPYPCAWCCSCWSVACDNPGSGWGDENKCVNQGCSDCRPGNCTWYARFRRPDFGDTSWGSPANWITAAEEAGFPIYEDPEPGYVLCMPGFPHVAYVTSVDPSTKNVVVLEQNGNCPGGSTGGCTRTAFYSRDTYQGKGGRFIGFKGGGPTPTPTNTPVTPEATSTPTPTSAPPSDEGATLCEHENFGGRCGTFTSDDGNLVDEYDDKATSIGIRGPFMATVYEHPNYGGIAETFSHNDSDLRNNPIGSDTITSLRVYPAVALYEDTGFGGKCETFINDDPNLNGNYIGDNKVSSIKVPSGYVAILYEHPNYVEPSEDFTGDDSDLRDNHIGNDRVSSIRVMTSTPTPTPTQTPVSGDVTIDRAYTTDAAGTPKIAFNAGEPIGLHFEVTNQGASFTVTCGWEVVYEYAVLNKEVSCDLPTGQSTHSWVPTLPSDAQSGSYQFWGYICSPRFLELYDSYCLIRTADFTVVGPTPTPTSTPSDTTPPTGRITSPPPGYATNTCPLTIQAEVSDDQSGVDRVEFHVWYDEGWHHIGDDYTSPYSIDWDCSSVGDQTVWLTIHAWDNAGNEVMDPGGYVDVILDRVEPTGYIVSPAPDSYIHSDQVDIVATASDDRSGVIGLQFFVWYDDGSGYDWHGLPLDWDGSDGWTSVWVTSSVEDQGSIGFWIYIFDYAGNIGAYSHGGITLDSSFAMT